MKTKMFPRTIIGATIGAFIAATMMAGLAQAYAQDTSRPDQQRDQLRQLEQKARDLKANGRHDEAREIMAKVDSLRAEGERGERKPGPERPMPPDNRRREELKAQHQKLLAEVEKLRSAGKERREAEIKKRIMKIEQELAQGEHPAPGADRNQWTRRQPSERPGQPPLEGPERERRQQHLKVAIDIRYAWKRV